MSRLAKVNEFVLRFANVNGTGSASANGLVARALFRMGLPVGPKNIFPSNIQGLPTWFEIRVSEAGYTGRRGTVDLMVAMNGQTFAEDVRSVEPGGYLLYDSSKPLAPELRRSDINFLDVPLTEMVTREFANPRQRLLFKNIAYVGVLSALLDIEPPVVAQLIREQFQGKEKLIPPNMQAFEMGRAAALERFACPLPMHAQRRDAIGDRILMDGNSAAGLGCVYAGATVAAWYPITPSTSLVDAFSAYCEDYRVNPDGSKRYAILQAEDELAAIGMVVGAAWNGARSFTATSGPGISLMTEFLGLAYYAEIPVVLFDIQRCGPSTGMPTRTQQSDLLSSAYASHGDTKHVLLFPASPKECFQMAAQAFDLAERLQTPVLVMSDLDLGMNDWLSEPLTWDDAYRPDRGKVLTTQQLDDGIQFYRYLDVDGDAIPYRTLPGTHPSKGAFFTRGSGHDRFGGYTEDGAKYQDNVDRLRRKFDTAATLLPDAVIERDAGSSAGIIYFGTSAEPMPEALDTLAAQGLDVDALRLRAFPFSKRVYDFIATHDTVFVVDQNRDGQLRAMLLIEGNLDPAKLVPVLSYDGMPVTADLLVRSISAHLEPVQALAMGASA
uniref:2-ketoglutarate: NADP oxidoreductase, alpha subunit n=1 Tax=uncultured bacterium P2N8 TaxID=1748285 RepID=A0A0U3TSD4_9BACT|nr:2-ketoglutarate: NADP oxidoreductase, alpha subunit [uncultured bacterium P2N8]